MCIYWGANSGIAKLCNSALLQGTAIDVFSALANAKSLRHVNLYRNSGLSGPLTPALSVTGGGLCQLAKRSLNTLTIEGVGLTGGVPACLLNNGSRLVEVHLGEATFQISMSTCQIAVCANV